jgi:hypothetical protein
MPWCARRERHVIYLVRSLRRDVSDGNRAPHRFLPVTKPGYSSVASLEIVQIVQDSVSSHARTIRQRS